MAEVNIWIELMKITPTALIASAVGVISYRQWRTAQDKFMFDLSGRRMKIIERTISLVQKAQHKNIDEAAFYEEKNEILRDARYLFEQDFINFLKENFSTIYEGVTYVSINALDDFDLENRRDIKRIKRASLNTIIDFQKNLFERSENYVHFHHKATTSFKGWLKEANKKRLSYGDHYQNNTSLEDVILYQNSQWILKKNIIVSAEFEVNYPIKIEDLLDITQRGNVDYYDFLLHMAEKNWVDYEEFEDVFLKSIEITPCLADKFDQEILDRSCIKAKRIARGKRIMLRF